jgi:hypothetical protein
LNIGSHTDAFDVNNGIGVAVLPDARYAFVTGFNQFIPGLVSHDPNIRPFTAGGNIGVIKDPFGTPRLVAATLMVPQSFPDNLVLSPDGKRLYAAYRGRPSQGIYVYDVEQIIRTVQTASTDDLSRFPLDQLNPAVFVGKIDTGADRPQGLSSRVTVGPDLAVTVDAGQRFEPGEQGTLRYETSLNQGASTGGVRWIERVFLVNDSGLRHLLQENTYDSAGARTLTVTFPTIAGSRGASTISTSDAAGTLRIEVQVDATNLLVEPNKANNTSSAQIDLRLPDLVAGSIEGPWLFLNGQTRKFEILGDVRDLTYNVRNNGDGKVRAGVTWIEEVWLGTNNDVTLPNNPSAGVWHTRIAVIRGAETSGPFEPGQTRARTVNLDLDEIVVPAGLGLDDLYWIVLVDAPERSGNPRALEATPPPAQGNVVESNEDNRLVENAPFGSTAPLRFQPQGTWTLNQAAKRATFDGIVEVGFEPGEGQTFKPLFKVNGRTTLDFTQRFVMISGKATSMVGQEQDLWNGEIVFQMGADGKLNVLGRATGGRVPGLVKMGGIEMDFYQIGLAQTNAHPEGTLPSAVGYPGMLIMYPILKWPSALGATGTTEMKLPFESKDVTENAVTLVDVGPDSRLNFHTADLTVSAGTTFSLNGFQMVPNKISFTGTQVEPARASAVGFDSWVVMRGEFTLPQFGGAKLEFKKGGGALSAENVGQSGTGSYMLFTLSGNQTKFASRPPAISLPSRSMKIGRSRIRNSFLPCWIPVGTSSATARSSGIRLAEFGSTRTSK